MRRARDDEDPVSVRVVRDDDGQPVGMEFRVQRRPAPALPSKRRHERERLEAERKARAAEHRRAQLAFPLPDDDVERDR